MSTFLFSEQLISPNAKRLWERSLSKNDRVLITGATGWFGQTAMHLMKGIEEIPVLALASKSRFFESIGFTYQVEIWDEKLVTDFKPTVVIDCAFLTREQAFENDLESYISTNTDLTNQLLKLTSLPSVKRVITISSGAAMYPADALNGTVIDNPYGYLKRKAELALRDVSKESNTKAVVARAWSVSGAFIGKPGHYALSDMILSALSGQIIIKAQNEVFRRYVSVEDLLALSLAQSNVCSFDVIDSEGPLLEMNDLAHHVAFVVNPKSTISRVKRNEDKPNVYYSHTNRWPSLCEQWEFVPEKIDQQIFRTYKGLKKSGFI